MPKKDSKLITLEKMNNLIFYSLNLLKKFPKSERFDLCNDIKNTLYTILKLLIYAWKEFKKTEKLKYLNRADIELQFLKTLILISYSEKLYGMGKQHF